MRRHPNRHRTRGALALALALGLALAAGCGRSAPEKKTDEKARREGSTPQVNLNPRLATGPIEVMTEAWLAPAVMTDDPKLDKKGLYSFTARDADIRDVLLSFGQQSPYNFVVAPDVAGRVTVDFTNVSLERALQAILEPHSLEYRVDGDMIWVQKPNTTPGLFALNYVITARNSSRSANAATIGTGAGTGTGGTTTGSSGGSGGGGDQVSGSEKNDIFQAIEKNIKLFLSDKGKFEINKEAGLITVLDYRKNLLQVNNYLQIVEERVGRQVVIEAKVLEINLSKDREFGIDWNVVLGDFKGQLLERTADRLLTATLDSKNVGFVIKAISEKHDTTVKTSPRVMTMNNQPALIVVGEEEVYFETIDELDPQTGEVTQTRTQPRSVTIGVSLSLVPQIAKDGYITMDIHPKITEKVGERVGPDGTSVPAVSVREVSTVAKVKDGKTIVIAGLTSERMMSTKSGAPVLSSIPVIGPALFTTRRSEKRKIELVIFLTARVVRK